jgi:holo-[acyl-carrier protein] synthase
MQTHDASKTSRCENCPTLVCGVDIVEIDHFARVLRVGGASFLRRVYTEAELQACAGRLPQLAVRFAAKEAISKALGTGLRGIHCYEMEILATLEGRPFVSLYGSAASRAEQMQICNWTVSLSHSSTFAVAFVIGSCLERHFENIIIEASG